MTNETKLVVSSTLPPPQPQILLLQLPNQIHTRLVETRVNHHVDIHAHARHHIHTAEAGFELDTVLARGLWRLTGASSRGRFL